MRRLRHVCAIFALLTIEVMGQEIPKTEIFVGYSYLRGKGAAVPTRADENTDMNGWTFSAVRNFNEWFALVADFSGHYHNRVTKFSSPAAREFRSKTSKNMHLFLAGPRISFYKTRKFTPYVHSLFGVVRAHTEAEDRLEPFPPFTVANTDVGFAAAFGVGVDVKLSRRFALRLIQSDYVLTRLDNNNLRAENKDNLRISAGITFRFGK